MAHLSLVQQNYIETIYQLCEEHGHAHMKAIAEALKIQMASATEAVQALSASGYVNYSKRQAITLTESGNRLAGELQKKHRILSHFFQKIGCNLESAEETACQVEHHIDANIANLIEKHLDSLDKTQQL